ncbi:MAG: nucleotidyltransferase domain-containing protein [Oscillospiraceae bacterium]|nr:nucleotidyltransferase domain-containing protein [Oscillospiraceae bacterium]
MMISDAFSQLCENIKLNNLDEMRTTVGEIAKKLNNHYYNLSSDSSSHMYVVGSIGRETAIKNASDLDLLFDLPRSTFEKFDQYESNGQSALLQEVKDVLKERYPKTEISGDGQVVVISFVKYTVELVPGFKEDDDTFTYPDTHDGGKWKITNPLAEQTECSECDKRSNENYKHFCRIIRSLRNHIGFSMSGLLIDTLVYNHFENNGDYSESSFDDYFDILKNVLFYMKGLDKDQSYWLAVGSNQQVYNTDNGSWIDDVADAYGTIRDETSSSNTVQEKLRDLFGSDFPDDSYQENATRKVFSQISNEEQFIEQMFPIDIKYSLHLECKVTQDGWRPAFLREMLRRHQWLSHNKSLDFFIEHCNCPHPYDIYWKVRNVGQEAERRNMIRGQIVKTDSTKHHERTSFYGPHYVECYIVKDGLCVAKDRIDVPINWG